MRLPEARQRAWHLAGSYWEFWPQVPKGQCGTSEGFGPRLVWLTFREHSSHFWLLGGSPQLDRLGEEGVGVAGL